MRLIVLETYERDVREFNPEDFNREGFSAFDEFIYVWCNMHDKPPQKELDLAHSKWNGFTDFFGWVASRPIEKYLAQVVRFEVMTDGYNLL